LSVTVLRTVYSPPYSELPPSYAERTALTTALHGRQSSVLTASSGSVSPVAVDRFNASNQERTKAAAPSAVAADGTGSTLASGMTAPVDSDPRATPACGARLSTGSTFNTSAVPPPTRVPTTTSNARPRIS